MCEDDDRCCLVGVPSFLLSFFAFAAGAVGMALVVFAVICVSGEFAKDESSVGLVLLMSALIAARVREGAVAFTAFPATAPYEYSVFDLDMLERHIREQEIRISLLGENCPRQLREDAEWELWQRCQRAARVPQRPGYAR